MTAASGGANLGCEQHQLATLVPGNASYYRNLIDSNSSVVGLHTLIKVISFH